MVRRARSILKSVCARIPLRHAAAIPLPRREDVLISGLSIQGRFGPSYLATACARTPPSAKPRLANGVAIHLQPDCDRHQREGIGQSIADFQIGVVLGEALGRKLKRSGQSRLHSDWCRGCGVYRRGGDGNPQRQ